MKLTEFDALTRQLLSPLFAEHGFTLEAGCFARDHASGVRHLVIVDIDTRTRKTFRVIVGINAQPFFRGRPPSEEGTFSVRFLTPGSLGLTAKNFVCFDQASAIESLNAVREAFPRFALPYLDAIDSLERAAEAIDEQYPFAKGKLFLMSGRKGEARVYLERHREYLKKLVQDAEIQAAVAETERLLSGLVGA